MPCNSYYHILGLADCFGEKFEALYEKYEKEGKFKKQVKAQQLWYAVIESQIETGTPYMLYKDACNGKSNQQNLGTIKCSNLCTEIVEYSAKDEVESYCVPITRFIMSYCVPITRFIMHHSLAARCRC